MAKIALLVEYNGSQYHGFQYQANAPTIQAELERAIYRLSGEALRVVAASRTDAGVHARGQVVSFRTQTPLPPSVWAQGLNFYLPQDIAVRKAFPVEEGFDVRKGATSREYCYYILNRPTRSPLKASWSYFFPHPLDLEAMNQACQGLLGERDLASFTPAAVPRTRRTVYRAGVERWGETIVFRMQASSFLPHQMRHTIGALLRVGRGRVGVADFLTLARTATPGLAGPALPPWGLCLMKVHYPTPLGEAQ